MSDSAPKSSLTWIGPLLGGLAALATASVAIYRELRSDERKVEAPVVTLESFDARPAQIAPGQATVLVWRSRNAETCNLEPGVGAVGVNGSRSVKPVADTNYTLRCHGAGDEIERSVSVSVVAFADLPQPEPVPVARRPAEPSRAVRDTATAAGDAGSQALLERAQDLLDQMDEAQVDDGDGLVEPPPVAYHCCDMTGMQRCPLASPIQVGAPCFCPFQGTGIACP
jgi:hypothetical protein